MTTTLSIQNYFIPGPNVTSEEVKAIEQLKVTMTSQHTLIRDDIFRAFTQLRLELAEYQYDSVGGLVTWGRLPVMQTVQKVSEHLDAFQGVINKLLTPGNSSEITREQFTSMCKRGHHDSPIRVLQVGACSWGAMTVSESLLARFSGSGATSSNRVSTRRVPPDGRTAARLWKRTRTWKSASCTFHTLTTPSMAVTTSS